MNAVLLADAVAQWQRDGARGPFPTASASETTPVPVSASKSPAPQHTRTKIATPPPAAQSQQARVLKVSEGFSLNTTTKPTPIPEELRANAQFVGWKSVVNPGAKKPRKLPIDPHTGKTASSTDPHTWADYDTAVAAVARYGLSGVGFVFGPADPYCGVDLDDCRNPQTGTIEPWAQTIIDRLDSYSEVSPSATGVKVFLRGKLPAGAKHNTPYHTGSVEMYDQARYFTVTGHHVPGTPLAVEPRQSELTAVFATVFGAKAQTAPAPMPNQTAPVTEGNRTPKLAILIGREKRAGTPLETVRTLAHALNQTFSPPHDRAKVDSTVDGLWKLPFKDDTPAAPITNFLADPRPKIRLRGDNRLLSDVASELGPHMAATLYARNGEIVECRDGALHPIGAQQLRTLAERHVIFYRVRSANESTVQVGTTLDETDARGILVSGQFLEHLKPLRHLNKVRLPVVRPDGRLELLPEGYDAETATLTDAQVNYALDMSFEAAGTVLADLFSEFEFADPTRSLAVAVAALLGLYAKQLIEPGELRPAFTFTKNAEGSGATCLAQCCIIPVLGDLPIGAKAQDDDEMRKSLTSAIRTGQDVFSLDNVKGQLNSPALEAFVSAPVWTDRLLGTNEVMTGPNTCTVFVTANGAYATPDWRRRSLFVELHLSVERAEDRIFKRPLSAPVLREMRPKILAACWALVRHWDEQGRPGPSRSHSAFPAWATIIGGIVEAAGFACPFTTAGVAIIADEDGQEMRLLVAQMIPDTAYTSAEIVDLCRTHGIFEGLLGASDADMGRPQRSAFGKMLARYSDRTVSDCRFSITGTGHAKRFAVHRANEPEPKAGKVSL